MVRAAASVVAVVFAGFAVATPLNQVRGIPSGSSAFGPTNSKFTWKGTKYLFGFGDSYTTTGYNVSAGINSPDPGYTATDGPTWIQDLAHNYNETNTKLYNLAYGGATTDAALVTPYLPTVLSLKDQVNLFTKYFSPPPAAAPWTGSNSLFAVWIGINDVGNAWGWTNETQTQFDTAVFTEWTSFMQKLYDAGGRNFLFLNLPPLQRTPLFVQQGASAVKGVKAATLLYNSALVSYTKALSQKNKDAKYMIYDSYDTFNIILDNGPAFGFKNTTDYCAAYANGTPTQTYLDPSCVYPVQEYFWLNTLHPVYPVMKYLAEGIKLLLDFESII